MALRKVKGAVERVFDKNLNDLVRGIRAHKDDEAKFIAQCIDEIKEELRQESIDVKSNAILKLCYLQMLGYDISWAAFNMVEVMSSSKFTYKRVGYLTASQAFREDTDVIMLTTNMIKKDFGSHQMYDAANALCGLSCFLTSDLAHDLANDIITLLSSSKPYIRKKAVLILYKVFLKYPDSLRPAFPKLKERLEDPDPGVQSAAVNVICELARKNPKNYLSLAPTFFKIMTSSTNNWMLIKIIKLFGSLTPLEPRLGKKLIEPLTNLIHSTSAMSLLYECINTVVAGMPTHTSSIQLCVQKLRILIEDSDQNLKYLGLLAMAKILKTHPKAVQPHKDLILQCLDDKDESIRLRALDLLYGMVNKKNLMEIVKKLMSHMEKAEGTQYRDELLTKIIEICSQSNYQHVSNFEWYISILVELTNLEGTRHGKLIASQMLDVAIRVKSIRPFTVVQMGVLLQNSSLLTSSFFRTGISDVLYAAAWIAGEFNQHLQDPKQTLVDMLQDKVTNLPGRIQAVYVQNCLKLYSRLLKEAEENEDDDEANALTALMLDKLPKFVISEDLELQERAIFAVEFIKRIAKLQAEKRAIAEDVGVLFEGELNPVAPKAQRKVPIPEGLDLDEWINEPPSSSEEDDVPGASDNFVKTRTTMRSFDDEEKQPVQLTPEEQQKAREQRQTYIESNPHYLKQAPRRRSNDKNVILPEVIKTDVNIAIPGFSLNDQDKKKKRSKDKKKKRRAESKDDDFEDDVHVDIVAEEMPEGAKSSDDNELDENDPHRLLNIDLDRPLDDSEMLPVVASYGSPTKKKHILETRHKSTDEVKKKHKKKKLKPAADQENINEKPEKPKKKKKSKKTLKELASLEDNGVDLMGGEDLIGIESLPNAQKSKPAETADLIDAPINDYNELL